MARLSGVSFSDLLGSAPPMQGELDKCHGRGDRKPDVDELASENSHGRALEEVAEANGRDPEWPNGKEVSRAIEGQKGGDSETSIGQGVERAVGRERDETETKDSPPVSGRQIELAKLDPGDDCCDDYGEQKGVGKAAVTEPVVVGDVEVEGDHIEVWEHGEHCERKG